MIIPISNYGIKKTTNTHVLNITTTPLIIIKITAEFDLKTDL